MVGWAVTFAWQESFGGLSVWFIKNRTALMPYLTIPTLIALFVLMHCAHGKFSRPLPGSGGHRRRARGTLPMKGRAPVCLPDTLEASRVGVRHSPCLSTTATAATTSAILEASPHKSVDGEDCVAGSQVLLPLLLALWPRRKSAIGRRQSSVSTRA